jgi:hypothetical protein
LFGNIPLWREIWLSGVFSEGLDLKASFDHGTFATVFPAEAYAIMACSHYCLRECMTGKTICICSESRAALLALSSHIVVCFVVLFQIIRQKNRGKLIANYKI